MVKSCDSAWPRPRRKAIAISRELATSAIARAAVRCIDHGYESARLEER